MTVDEIKGNYSEDMNRSDHLELRHNYRFKPDMSSGLVNYLGLVSMLIAFQSFVYLIFT